MREQLIRAIKLYKTDRQKAVQLAQMTIKRMNENAKDLAELKEAPGTEDNLQGLDKDGVNLVMMAAKEGAVEIMEMLLAKQENLQSLSLDAKDQYYARTALHHAILGGSLACVETILKQNKNKELLEVQDRHGLTPLMLAAALGHLEIVKCLVAHNANVYSTIETEITGNKPGASIKVKCMVIPLMLFRGYLEYLYPEMAAASINDGRLVQCMEILLKAGADLDADLELSGDVDGDAGRESEKHFKFPLFIIACGEKLPKVIEFFLKQKLIPNINKTFDLCPSKESPIEMAAFKFGKHSRFLYNYILRESITTSQQLAAVQALLEAKPNPESLVAVLRRAFSDDNSDLLKSLLTIPVFRSVLPSIKAELAGELDDFACRYLVQHGKLDMIKIYAEEGMLSQSQKDKMSREAKSLEGSKKQQSAADNQEIYNLLTSKPQTGYGAMYSAAAPSDSKDQPPSGFTKRP